MKKVTIALATALILAACGHHKHRDNQPAPTQRPTATATNRPTATATATSQPTATAQPSVSPTVVPRTPSTDANNYGGQALVANAKGAATGLSSQAVSGSRTQLKVGGKTIDLTLPNISAGETTNLNGANINGKIYKRFAISGRNYQNSVFGYINDGDKDYIFSQGNVTKDMPTSGKAEYDGSALISKAGGDIARADADFNVDFASKVLNGVIAKDNGRAASNFDFNPINIKANISGSSFTSDGSTPAQVQGNFYGDNARELGGLVQDASQQIGGSFGAVKEEAKK